MSEIPEGYIHISKFSAIKKLPESFVDSLIKNGDYKSKVIDGEVYVLYQEPEKAPDNKKEQQRSVINLNIGEEILLESFGLKLTNYRIIDDDEINTYGSVTLDSISSCYVTKIMNVKALVIGITLLFIAILMANNDFKSGSFCAAVIGTACLVFFFSTMKNVLRLNVHGSTNYDYTISSFNLALGKEFVEAFTTAKLIYLGKIQK